MVPRDTPALNHGRRLRAQGVLRERGRVSTPEIRRWIAASALIGFGQQVYVVLRNQLLHDLGLPASLLGVVQGCGAAAGILAGAAGLWMFPRRSTSVLLRAGVVGNAAGFAVQAVATRPWEFVLGATVAGIGIQMLTMASGPFLARRVTVGDRVQTYALQMVAIQTMPGALGAVLGGEIQRRVVGNGSSVVLGHRAALGAGAVAVALALAPLRGISSAIGPIHGRLSPVRDARPLAGTLTADALLFFGAGLAVPFLQFHLHATHGVPPYRVGWYFGAAMLAGTASNLAAPRLARVLGETSLLALLHVATAAGFLGLAAATSERGVAAALVARAAFAVAATPLWTALLHARLRPDEGDAVAAWRMLCQSVAWAVANLLAAAAFARGQGAIQTLLYGASLAQFVAAVGCRRSLSALARRGALPRSAPEPVTRQDSLPRDGAPAAACFPRKAREACTTKQAGG